MKPLELSEEQKNRLLEMCKSFYSDLQKIAFDAGVEYYGSKEEAKVYYCGFYITGHNHIQCSYPIDSRDDSFHEHLIESTHWFEFCWQILRKILETEPARIRAANIIEIFGLVCFNQFESLHPVDYLYQEFK